MRYTEEMLHGSNRYELLGMKEEAYRLIKAADASLTLDELLAVHRAAYDCGIWNRNLDVDEHGMFRAKDMDSLCREDVWLGNHYGVATNNIPFFESMKQDDPAVFMTALDHYKSHLVSNLTAIAGKIEDAVKEEEQEHLRPRLRKIFGSSIYASRPNPAPNDEDYIKMSAARLGAACLNLQKLTTIPSGWDAAKRILSSLTSLQELGAGLDSFFHLEREAFSAGEFGYWIPVARKYGTKYVADYVQKLDDDSFRVYFSNNAFRNTPAFTVFLDPDLQVVEHEGLEFNTENVLAQLAVNFEWQMNEEKKKNLEIMDQEKQENDRDMSIIDAGKEAVNPMDIPFAEKEELKIPRILENPEEYVKNRDFIMVQPFKEDPEHPGQNISKDYPMRAYKVDEDVTFTTSWGQVERARKGDYILQDPMNPENMYGYSAKEIEKNYRPATKEDLIMLSCYPRIKGENPAQDRLQKIFNEAWYGVGVTVGGQGLNKVMLETMAEAKKSGDFSTDEMCDFIDFINDRHKDNDMDRRQLYKEAVRNFNELSSTGEEKKPAESARKEVEQKLAVSSAPRISKSNAAALGKQHKDILCRTLEAVAGERVPATPVVIDGDGHQLLKEDGVSCSLMRSFYEDWLPDMLTLNEIHELGCEIVSPDVKPYLCKGVAHSDGTIGTEIRYNLADTTFPEQQPEVYRQFCEFRRNEERQMCGDFFKSQSGVIDANDVVSKYGYKTGMNEVMALELLDRYPQYEQYKSYIKTILYHNIEANLGVEAICGNFRTKSDMKLPDDQTAYRIHRAVGVYLEDKYEGTSRRTKFAPAKEVINTIKNNLQQQKTEAMRRRINGPEQGQGKSKSKGVK